MNAYLNLLCLEAWAWGFCWNNSDIKSIKQKSRARQWSQNLRPGKSREETLEKGKMWE